MEEVPFFSKLSALIKLKHQNLQSVSDQRTQNKVISASHWIYPQKGNKLKTVNYI